MEKWFILPFSFFSFSLCWLVLGAFLLSMTNAFKRSIVWLFFSLILFMAFITYTLMMFFILFELALVPIILMIIFWGSQPERLSAGLYLLTYTSMVSTPFILVILFTNGSMFNIFSKESSSLFTFVLLLPFLVKMPVMGLHFWLPKAHVEASTSGSMILAGVLLKLGSYGVFRLSFLFFLKLGSSVMIWLFLSVLASAITFMQSDVKKLVAYSSVTHMTLMMLGLAVMGKDMMMIVLLTSLAHGWASMGMFSQAGLMSSSAHTRLGIFLKTETKFHWFIIMFGIILAMNASLPPFPSFFPELMLVNLMSSSSILVFMFSILSILVCYYNVYLFMWFFHSKSFENKLGMTTLLNSMTTNFIIFISLVSLLWFSVL